MIRDRVRSDRVRSDRVRVRVKPYGVKAKTVRRAVKPCGVPDVTRVATICWPAKSTRLSEASALAP
eukprot:4487078-Prymnesium_polylepis.1